MAQETVLKVSLKEYKQSIDELRASLLTLESTDKAYISTVEEIREKQEKLNEVMRAGKSDSEALEGSYNALTQEMAQLKKAWKATNDEAERASIGDKVKEINDKLKDMDASIGNYQRNVGNYGGAFEEAMKSMVDGCGGLDGALGKNFQTIKKMIPLIKQTTKAATTGLNGIKKALIGTGIGALVVAVGLLIANWDKLVSLVKKWTGEEEKARLETERHVKAMNDLANASKKTTSELTAQRNLLAAQGNTEEEILTKQIAKIEEMKKEAQKVRVEVAKKIGRGYAVEYSDQAYQLNEADSTELVKGLKGNEKTKMENAIAEANEAFKNFNKLEETLNEFRLKLELEKIKTKTSLQKADEEIALSLKSEIEQLTIRYNQQKKEFERFGIDTTNLTKEYNKKIKELKEAKKGDGTATTDPAEEARLKQREAIIARVKDIYKTELEIIDEKYEEEKALIAGDEEAIDKLTEEWLQKRGEVLVKELEDQKSKINKLAQDTYNTSNTRAQNENTDTKRHNGVTMDEDSMELINANFEADNKLLEQKIANLKTYMSEAQLTIEEQEALQYELTELQAEQEDLRLQHSKDVLAKQKAITQSHVDNSVAVWNSMADILDSVAGAIENQINWELQEGKITDEEAKKKFEQVKAMQIAVATMDMLSGITAAVSGVFTTHSGIWDIAIAAAQASAIAAAGIANIAQISHTTLGGSSSSSSAIAIPAISDSAPIVTANTTGLSDTDKLQEAFSNVTLEVKVSDIEAVQNKMNSNVAQTTW